MRILRSGFTVLSLVTLIGCAETEPSGSHRHNVPMQNGTAAPADAPKTTAAFTVNGQVGTGSDTAKTVDVLALGKDGALTPVATADVKPGGAFQAAVPQNGSATGIFILKVKDLAGAVVGSGVVNGLPAFVQAFAVTATVDATTSFKAEVLTTIAKGGVPGVQNYLNVLDAYVDSQLANSIAVAGVLSTDLTTLVTATSDAVIAAENVITDALGKAGIPVDLGVLQAMQSTAVSGVTGLVTTSTGELVTNAKNLVAALQAATAGAAKPVDDAIFNAVVNGGAVFGSTFKKGAPPATLAAGTGKPDVGFAASKAAFSLETALTTTSIFDTFGKLGGSAALTDAVTNACASFTSAVGGAGSFGELEAAKSAFTDILLGKNAAAQTGGILQLLASAVENVKAIFATIESTVAPLVTTLEGAFTTFDPGQISDALATFDAETVDLPSKLKGALGDRDAAAMTSAFRLVQKQVVK